MSVRPSLSKQSQFIIISLVSFTTVLCVYMYYEDLFNRNNIVNIYQTILSRSRNIFRMGFSSDELRNTLSQHWQQVGSIDLHVFSAYYRADENFVQIIGIATLTTVENCTCMFHGQNAIEQDALNGTLEILPEHHSRPFSAVFIRCPLKKDHKPPSVGITVGNDTTYLRVIYASPRRYNFTVCTPSLHGPFRDQFRIVEMVEADMLLGADFFIIYNHSTSPEVDQVLRHYEKRGIMEIIQWNLPSVDVWYWGQIASIQDCTLASRYKSRYLVLKDFDELIVPHKHKNLNELMAELDKVNSSYAAFLFRNTFFRLNWNPDLQGYKGAPSAGRLHIQSLLHIWREKNFFNAKVRSKAIVHPEQILTGGIHFAWKMKKGYKEYNVDTKIGYLHHYRSWGGNSEKVKDERMRHFSDDLINNVNKTLTQLGYKNINGTIRLST